MRQSLDELVDRKTFGKLGPLFTEREVRRPLKTAIKVGTFSIRAIALLDF